MEYDRGDGGAVQLRLSEAVQRGSRWHAKENGGGAVGVGSRRDVEYDYDDGGVV